MVAKNTQGITQILQKIDLNLENSLPKEAARQIAKTAMQLFDADFAAIFSADRTAGREQVLFASSDSPIDAGRHQWLATAVAETSQAVVVREVGSKTSGLDEFLRAEGISGFATALLQEQFSSTPLAILYLERGKEKPSCFDAVEIESFAKQASIILHNSSLLQTVENLRGYRERVINVGEPLRALVDWIRQVIGADIVTIHSYFEDSQRFDDSPYISGQRHHPNFYRPGYYRTDDLAWLAVLHRESVFAVDSSSLFESLGGTPGNRIGSFEKREGIASAAMLPLFVESELYGVVFFNFRQRQEFDQKQRELLSSLAALVAQAVKQTRERGRIAKRHAKELGLLDEIDRKIGGELELKDLLYEILGLAKEHIEHAEDATIMLCSSGTKELQTEASIGPTRDKRLITKLSLENGHGIIKWACDNRSPARVDDVNNEEWRGRYHLINPNTKAELDVPMFDDEQLIGAINFESSTEPFRWDDQNFLVILANRAVQAIKNAKSKSREKAITQILEAGRNIADKESSKAMLDTILDSVLSTTQSTQGQIFLHDPRWDDLYLVADRGVKSEMRHRHVPRGGGVVSWVMEHKEPHIANLNEARWSSAYVGFSETKGGWQLTVPIFKNRQEVRGVIIAERPADRPFTKEDQDLVAQMANLAEIALRSAEHSEMRQRLAVLHRVDVDIISQLDDPEKVLLSILDQALLLTEAERGDLHLYQNGKPHTSYFAVKEEQKIVERRTVKDEALEQAGIKLGIVAHVAETWCSYRTQEDAQKDPLYKGEDFIHSEVAVPLLTGGKDGGEELLGVLNLESSDYDELTEDDVNLMELLAGQAVIAYQNVLFSRQEQEATRRYRILRDVGQRLSEIASFEDLERAYNVVVEPLKPFATGGWITVRRYEEQTHALVCKWHDGPKEGRTDFSPHPVGRGVGGYVAEQWLSGKDRRGKAVVIADAKNPPPGIQPAPVSEKVRSLVCAPIYFKAQFYGSLSLSNEQVNYFSGTDTDLIEGLAAQLGVTLHRLEAAQERQAVQERLKEEEMMAKMGHYASNIAHRFGNNFRHVRGEAIKIGRELNEQGVLSAQVNLHLKEIIETAEQTSKLNQQFKAFAEKSKGGSASPPPSERVVLRHLLDDVIKTDFKVSQEEEGKIKLGFPPVECSFCFPDELATVIIIPEQISDVLFHLISNALDAMPTGGNLSFDARNLDSGIELRVTDTGEGIPEEEQAKVFSPFYPTKKEEGTGMGLWTCKRYATDNGGSLTLHESRPGRTTFILVLPRAE